MWGFLGLIITFLLLITSNFLAVKILGKHWKTVQRLSYLLLFVGASHVFFLENELSLWKFFNSFAPVFLVLTCWILAYKNIQFKNFPGKFRK
jgi:DMSO/TMAO reductase YedYZ heme-binding membrane subunit